MDRYKNESTRLQGYNYANNGSYFITINAYKWQPIFATLENGEIFLSKIGQWIDQALKTTPQIRKYTSIGEYIIMPNHIHFVVHIHHGVAVPQPLPFMDGFSGLKFDFDYRNARGGQSKNLASIIRGIKSDVTTKARKEGIKNQIWHTNYYEHIIRSQADLERIEKYIRDNPYK